MADHLADVTVNVIIDLHSILHNDHYTHLGNAMTHQEKIGLKRLATDLEPFIGSIGRLVGEGDTRLAGQASAAYVALQDLVFLMWKEVGVRK